jgi:hypothetical protein
MRINYIFAININRTVKTFLRPAAADFHITITVAFLQIAIIRINVFIVKNGHPRNTVKNFHDLLLNWPLPINFPAVTKRIPLVAPPFFLFINWKLFVWSVDRQNIFAAQIRFGLIKNPLVAPSQPSLITTRWTPGWFGHINFTVKITILRIDNKILLAILTNRHKNKLKA